MSKVARDRRPYESAGVKLSERAHATLDTLENAEDAAVAVLKWLVTRAHPTGVDEVCHIADLIDRERYDAFVLGLAAGLAEGRGS